MVRVNPNNQAFDKALSDFNKKHVFNMSGLWDLPIRPKGKLNRALLGGWSLNGIVNLAAGQPINIVSGVDNARTGTPNQRADIVGSPYFEGDRTRAQVTTEYLRKAAFAPNALGTFGTLGRNVFIGPGYANVDLGMAKAFAMSERVKALLRFEAFNSLNRANFNLPTAAQNSGNFMRITTAQDPRILQLAMRLTW